MAKTWEQRLAELKKYKSKNGHCNVNTKSGPLGDWVKIQRKLHKKGAIPAKHEELLTDIGFDWSPMESIWEQRLAELKEYKSQNGHCNVKTKSGSLGQWVRTQRRCYKNDELPMERIERLEEVGFMWEAP